MPRKLPWQQGSSTSVARPKRLASSINPPRKRPKVEKLESGSEVEDKGSSPRQKKKGSRGKSRIYIPNSLKLTNEGRTPSTSPPLEPPGETFMNEGVEHDDKYRMVEDEFLTVAQKFTVHLHAAEYKRQEKMVKARNAEAINSISRPVTGRMPGHTKQKVEGVGRAKAQRTTLQSLLGKTDNAEVSDESDEGNGLPYVGTTLHGLMDSPRRRTASLVKVGSNPASTRAAAGFRKPAASSKSPEKAPSESPISKLAFRPSQNYVEESISESFDDDDDDLDASILAPKLTLEQKDICLAELVPTSGTIVSASSLRQPSRSSTISKTLPFLPLRTSDEDSSRLSYVSNSHSRTKSDSSSRITKRLEQARSQKFKQEQEEQTKKKLDIIPTFL